MSSLRADLTHASRRLRRSPGFSIAATLTLALGIGFNTAVFSIVKLVLLEPLPYGAPERVAMIWGNRAPGKTTWLSAPEIQDYQAETSTFDHVAAYTGGSANLTGSGEPERVVTAAVSPNFFATLAVSAEAGRLFGATDRLPDIAGQIVLSDELWRRRFAADRSIVGQTIQMNGAARTVIGVLPPSFRLPLDFADDRPAGVFVPLDLAPNANSWGDHSFIGVARLRAGTSVAQANATLAALEERWVRDGHWRDRKNGRTAVPVSEFVLGPVSHPLWVLLGAVGVILLIACANVTNLMLAHSDDRQREIALRAALGADRARIVRQLLSESMLLAVIGGVAGLALAFAAVRLLPALHPASIPRVGTVRVDTGVLAMSILLTVGTGLIVGLLPALQFSRHDLKSLIHDGARGGTGGRARQRWRDALSVAQLAFSVVLLTGALLLLRSYTALRQIDPGFSRVNALTFRVSLPVASYPQSSDVIRFYDGLRRDVADLPGVRAVGATRLLPLTGTIGDWSIRIEGRDALPGENPNGDWQVVTPGYFESMGIALVHGRTFTDADDAHAPLVAVVSQTMAERYWPNANVIGKRFAIGSLQQPWITIVGVTREVRHNALTETPRAEMYVPHAQWAAAGASTPRAMTFVLRTTAAPLALVARVRTTVGRLDAGIPIADVRTLEQVTDATLAEPRFNAAMFGTFAALAMTLAGVGVYGVIALLVSRRRREIGIRAALGARPVALVRMVVGRGLTLALIGVSLGVASATGLTRLLASMLYAVKPLDAETFLVAPAALCALAILASLAPARAAAGVDPVVALREE